MRFLVIPSVTKTSGSSVMLDSSTKLLKTLVDNLGETYCYWLFPKICEKMTCDFDPLRNTVLYEESRVDSFDMRDDYLDTNVLLKFSRRYGIYPIDAVITMRKGAPVELVKLNDMYRPQKPGGIEHTWVPVFLIEPNAEELNEHKNLINAMSYASGISIFLSELERKKARKFASKYLAGSILKNMRMEVAPLGLDFAKIDSVGQDIRKGHEITKVFYGWRMNEWKNTALIFDLFGYLKSSGRMNVQFIATTTTGEMAALGWTLTNKWGKYFKLYPNCGWEKYIRYAKACHVGVVASKREALAAAFIEIMYCGVILLFPDKDWVYQVVPKDYPFIYRSRNEMYGLLAYVVDEYDSAWEKFKHMPEYLREKFNEVETMHNLAHIVRSEVGEHRNYIVSRSIYSGKGGALARAVGLRDSISWKEFAQGCEKNFDNLKFPQDEFLRRRSNVTDYELYLYMLEKEGFRDLLDNEFPNFIRGDRFTEVRT